MVEIVAKNYANVLFELALAENLQDRIASELKIFSDAVKENPMYMTFLTAPNISKAEKLASIDAVFGEGEDKLLENFVKVLLSNGRIAYLHAVACEYEALLREHAGVVRVEAVTASAMSEEQKSRLIERLEQRLNKKVALENIIDTGIIGGMKIRMGEQLLDMSIGSRLHELRTELNK